MTPKQKTKPVSISPIAERAHIAAIAVEREDGTWCAMKSDTYYDFHMVLAFGEALPESTARALFPEFASKCLPYRE